MEAYLGQVQVSSGPSTVKSYGVGSPAPRQSEFSFEMPFRRPAGRKPRMRLPCQSHAGMASKNQPESVAYQASFASDAPFVCMDCARRHFEPVGFYRVAARAPGDCAACGEGPLVDIRDPGVIEGLRARDEQWHVERRRRTSMAAMGVAAAIVTPLIAVASGRLYYGLLTGPVVSAVACLAMLVVASLLASRCGSSGASRRAGSSRISTGRRCPRRATWRARCAAAGAFFEPWPS